MPAYQRANTGIKLIFALLLTIIALAGCNLGPPENQAVDITAQPSSTGPAATRTLLATLGIPTSRAVTVTPISFPTRVGVQVTPPPVIFPPRFTPFPTSTPLPYNIVILSPLPGNVVAGNVQVIGSASHPGFLQYRLEFGPEFNPNNLWFPLTGIVQTPVINGVLGIWNTTTGGSSDGFYQVRLRVFLRDGSQQTTVVNAIKIQNSNPTPVPTNTPSTPPPVAAFTQDFTAGNAPLTVRFFNQSVGQITGYNWNFGNGFSSSEANPSVVYNTPGVYTVVLTVNGPGGTANVSRQINVTSSAAPVAAFTPNKVSGPAPLTVSFANQSTGNIGGYQWDFGDSTGISTAVNPTHTFNAVGTYNVILKVTGPGGSSTMIRQITVVNPQIQPPVAEFAANPTTGTTPLTVAFANSTTGQVTQYLWDFNGDGITDSVDKDPSFVYTVGGTYKARLTAIGPGGQNTKTLDIIAQAPPSAPVANFTANPTSGTAPLTVAFTNTTTGTATDYVWDFNNDGTTDSTETSPSVTYNTAGSYVVKLTATNAGGSTSKQATITVNTPVQLPDAQFTANPTSGDAPLTVMFTNTSTGTVDTLSWDFNGDGTADNTSDNAPTYEFTTPGTYNATLTVTNSAGSDSATLAITVNEPVPGAPVASFTANPTSGDAPLEVTFTNTSTGTVDTLAWDFNGDGTTDNTSDDAATFTYDTPGTYNAKLTVSNAGGSNAATVIITVNTPVPDAPVASFTADPTSGDTPLLVTFTNTSTGTIDTFSWDFNGDGVPDDTISDPATFTYNTPGTYNATLTVTNTGGSDTATVAITVNAGVQDAPVASFTASPTSGDAPLTVTFTNTSTGTIDTFSWDFNGDGTADNTSDNSATFTYDTAGTYNATLTVTNAGGSDSETVAITVSEPIPGAPVAEFNADVTSGDAPLTVTFTNTSSGTVDSLSWDFNGDGTADNTSANTATFTYDTAGTYNATLTVTNAGGSDSISQAISVSVAVPDAPAASFTANPTSGDAPLTVTFTNTSTGTVDSLSWDFNGDGTADNTTDNSVTVTYDTPGTYNATLTISNGGGSDNMSQAITVNSPVPTAPIAAFTADPTSGDASLTVTFTNTSTGTVDALAWDFNGDGTADNTSDNTVTFTYDTPGTYNATLTVSNGGGSDNMSQAITVNSPVPTAPIAAFTADPTSGDAPLTVTFTNTSSGTVDTLSWDFNGDGTADNTTDGTATFTFDSAGTYNATLTVTNAGGSDSISQAITATEAVPEAPVANFTTDVSTGTAPLTVTFTNLSTGTVTSLAWDFNGDGVPDDTVSNPATFTYNSAGTFNATLTVANAGGSDSISVPIVVSAPAAPPVASFTTSTISGDAPLTVTFTNTSTGTIDSFAWDFNGDSVPDNTTDTTANFTFDNEGSFNVTLTVNGAGQTSSTSQTITVNAVAQTAQPGIVYASNGELFLMNTDGTNAQNLTNHPANDKMPSVSANGTRVVFVSDRDGSEDIYVLTISDLSVARLTTDGNSDIDPAFSPDSNQIVFASNRSGVASGNPADYDIFVMGADGSSQVQLTSSAGAETQPVWSPDGQRIAYVSNENDSNNEIYTMRASDGLDVVRLTNDGGDDVNPAWSPDGNRIAFASNRAGIAGGDANDYDISTMNASDGGDITQITTDSAPDREPAWSANGSQIVFVSSRNTGEDNIYIMGSDGASQTQLTTGGSNDASPSWRAAP